MEVFDIKDDPRADPRLLLALKSTGSDVAAPSLPVNGTSPIEMLISISGMMETMGGSFLNGLITPLEPTINVVTTTVTIKGVDDNDIILFISIPTNRESLPPTIPCIYHTHGGGMAIFEANYPYYSRWRTELAAEGMVVVGVEYRNSGGKLGAHPFPRGLNDCLSGLLWVSQNKETLGISKIIVSGESGGGNLAITTTMLAKRKGFDCVSGVYAQCPFISNMYNNCKESLQCPSLARNNGYTISCGGLDIMAALYTEATSRDPLAWPYWATSEDLKDLPPHIISLNELDPLYDEGLQFYRKLMSSGVPAACRTLHGTTHACELAAGRLAMPEVHRAVIHDIFIFAKNV